MTAKDQVHIPAYMHLLMPKSEPWSSQCPQKLCVQPDYMKSCLRGATNHRTCDRNPMHLEVIFHLAQVSTIHDIALPTA